MQEASSTTPQPSFYRLQDPTSQLYVRFSWKKGERGKYIVGAKLAPRPLASRFPSWKAAAEAFARYLAGECLEIVRCDA